MDNNSKYWVKICLNMVVNYIPCKPSTAEEYDNFSNIASHALAIAESAQVVLVNKNESLLTADAFDLIGYCHCKLGEYASSLYCYEKASNIYVRICHSLLF